MGKPKQGRLPGMVPKAVADIEDAMEEYRTIRDERMAMTQRECEANEKLVKAMRGHHVTEYTSPDGKGKAEIITEQKVRAKVSSVKVSGDEVKEEAAPKAAE